MVSPGGLGRRIANHLRVSFCFCSFGKIAKVTETFHELSEYRPLNPGGGELSLYESGIGDPIYKRDFYFGVYDKLRRRCEDVPSCRGLHLSMGTRESDRQAENAAR